MRTETEVQAELDRLVHQVPETPVSKPGAPFFGEPHHEALVAMVHIERGSRIAILRWVLGAELS
jgi:hypothetical protein